MQNKAPKYDLNKGMIQSGYTESNIARGSYPLRVTFSPSHAADLQLFLPAPDLVVRPSAYRRLFLNFSGLFRCRQSFVSQIVHVPDTDISEESADVGKYPLFMTNFTYFSPAALYFFRRRY